MEIFNLAHVSLNPENRIFESSSFVPSILGISTQCGLDYIFRMRQDPTYFSGRDATTPRYFSIPEAQNQSLSNYAPVMSGIITENHAFTTK